MEKDTRTKEDIEREIFLMRYEALKQKIERETGKKVDIILGCTEEDADWRQFARKRKNNK